MKRFALSTFSVVSILFLAGSQVGAAEEEITIEGYVSGESVVGYMHGNEKFNERTGSFVSPEDLLINGSKAQAFAWCVCIEAHTSPSKDARRNTVSFAVEGASISEKLETCKEKSEMLFVQRSKITGEISRVENFVSCGLDIRGLEE